MKIEDIAIGMTVTVRPAGCGIAKFDGVVKGVAGNFVMVDRGYEHKEQWAVGAHECQPHDGLTDFQRGILALVRVLKSISVEDIIIKLEYFKSTATAREKGAQEAAVLRTVKRHPLSNFIEAKRAEGNNRKERFWVLSLKEAQ